MSIGVGRLFVKRPARSPTSAVPEHLGQPRRVVAGPGDEPPVKPESRRLQTVYDDRFVRKHHGLTLLYCRLQHAHDVRAG